MRGADSFLSHSSNRFSQVCELHVLDIYAVDEDLALLGIVESGIR